MSHPKTPCARCGIPCTTGGNTRRAACCRDCRAVAPTYCQQLTTPP